MTGTPENAAAHLRDPNTHAYPTTLHNVDPVAEHAAEHDPAQWGGDWGTPAPPGSRRSKVQGHTHPAG